MSAYLPCSRARACACSLGRMMLLLLLWARAHFVHVHPVDPSSSSILFGVSIYLVRHIRSFVNVNDPVGDTISDPALGLLPRWAVATFYALYGGVVVYTNVDMLYHVTTPVMRIVLQQPAWQ